MGRLARLTLYFSWLLICAIKGANADREKFVKILENGDVERSLQLLRPGSLLKARRRSYEVVEPAINSVCFKDLAALEAGLMNREQWALKMLDSSSKIPSGILEGNIVDLGVYDECLGIAAVNSSFEIHGRHCMYSIGFPDRQGQMPLLPTLSICVPSSCEPSDIMQLANETIGDIAHLVNLNVTVASVQCSPLDESIWDTRFSVCAIVLAVFVAILLVCSLCDMICRKYDSEKLAWDQPVLRALADYSLVKSAEAIISTKVNKDNLPVIHGIRAISMAWIVLGHQYFYNLQGVHINNLYILDWIHSWNFLSIFLSLFAVDTFLALSGFLMTYAFLKQMSKQKSIKFHIYYLHRFWRLTPALIAIVVITMVFVPKISSGPLWENSMHTLNANCDIKWWSTILYVQNFVDTSSWCIPHLWYLAVDMQLFWISPILIYPLHKKPKLGLAILSLFFLASLIIPATIIAVNEYVSASFLSSNEIEMISDSFRAVYQMPYTRASPWLVGIFFGYKTFHKRPYLSTLITWTGWLLTVLAFVTCILGTRYFIREGYQYNALLEAFFTALSKPIWAIGVCWIIYSSSHNRAGPISTILSSKFFLPLSRISYCTYLVHMIVECVQYARQRVPMHFSDFEILTSYLGSLVLSIGIAFIFSLLFESPILTLEKKLLRRKDVSQSESQVEIRPDQSLD